jgi:hypothetical protein
VAELNRAVAVAEAGDVDAALATVERLELDRYHYLHATRADLLRRLGRIDDARRTHDAEAKHFPRLPAMMTLALMAGDEAEVEKLFRMYVGRRGPCPWHEHYEDEDAGRLLRADRWAAMRAKYPPPAGW